MTIAVSISWDGITDPLILGPIETAARHELANAARDYDWDRMLHLLRENPKWVNVTRPAGTTLFAPLHQTAYAGASSAVIEELVAIGAWRTLQNSRGERPEDVGERQGHLHLRTLLVPMFKRKIPSGVLLRMEAVFHNLICSRAEELVSQARLRLPPLEPLLEADTDAQPFWFAIPGMAGGFSYRLVSDGVEAILISESWCRMVDGSGQRHEITSDGSRLIDEGFV